MRKRFHPACAPVETIGALFVLIGVAAALSIPARAQAPVEASRHDRREALHGTQNSVGRSGHLRHLVE